VGLGIIPGENDVFLLIWWLLLPPSVFLVPFPIKQLALVKEKRIKTLQCWGYQEAYILIKERITPLKWQKSCGVFKVVIMAYVSSEAKGKIKGGAWSYLNSLPLKNLLLVKGGLNWMHEG
jgi:hypothetical protein